MKKESLKNYLIRIRRTLHKNPEVGADLPETIKLVTSELDAMGIEYQMIEGGGIIGTVGKGKKTLLIREDMDALPIKEKSGEPFASTNGNMHACGHDFHTSMLLGAARNLKENEKKLKNRIILFFECDEERGGGLAMLRETKIFEKRIKPDAAIVLHCLPTEGVGPGTYLCHEGPANTALVRFNIKVIGKTAHGAVLHEGKNPINVLNEIYNAIQTVVPLEVDSRRCSLVSVCYMTAGKPSVANIIPGEGDMGGTIRALNTSDVEYIAERVSEIAKGICKAMRMKCRVTFHDSHPAAVNSPEMVDLVNKCAAKLGMENLNIPPQMTSDSFGYFTDRCPGAYVWIGAGGAGKKYEGGVLHSPKVCFNEGTLEYGAELLTKVAMEF